MSDANIADMMAGILGRVSPMSEDAAAQLEADERKRSITGKRADLEAAGVPARMLNDLASGKPTRTTAALDAVTEWMADESRDLLVLSGGVGCGKTFAAAWACTRARWPVFCDPLRLATLKRFEGQFNAADIAPLADCSLLVLDDLASEFTGERGSTLELIESLLNRRQARQLKTCITTNASDQQFRDRYGARIVSRIRESGRFVRCGSDDLRAGLRVAK